MRVLYCAVALYLLVVASAEPSLENMLNDGDVTISVMRIDSDDTADPNTESVMAATNDEMSDPSAHSWSFSRFPSFQSPFNSILSVWQRNRMMEDATSPMLVRQQPMNSIFRRFLSFNMRDSSNAAETSSEPAAVSLEAPVAIFSVTSSDDNQNENTEAATDSNTEETTEAVPVYDQEDEEELDQAHQMDASRFFSEMAHIRNLIESRLSMAEAAPENTLDDNTNTPPKHQGCPLMRACGDDIQRVCATARTSAIAGAVARCLHNHMSEISDTCVDFLKQREQKKQKPAPVASKNPASGLMNVRATNANTKHSSPYGVLIIISLVALAAVVGIAVVVRRHRQRRRLNQVGVLVTMGSINPSQSAVDITPAHVARSVEQQL